MGLPLPFPVGPGGGGVGTDQVGDDVPQPPPRGLEGDLQLPRPDSAATETTANDTLYVEEYEEEGNYYEYYPYDYDYNGNAYNDFDDNTRRKRQPKKGANEVEGTPEPPNGQESNGEATNLFQHSETYDGRLTRNLNLSPLKKSFRKRKENERNEPESNFWDRRESGTAAESTHSLSHRDHSQQRQQKVQKTNKKRGMHSRRSENLHPLKAFGLRSKREAKQLSGKSSTDDVTWI